MGPWTANANENLVRQAATELGDAERRMAEAYLIYASGGQSSYMAQRMAEEQHVQAVRTAQAEYEIAVARLRRS